MDREQALFTYDDVKRIIEPRFGIDAHAQIVRSVNRLPYEGQRQFRLNEWDAYLHRAVQALMFDLLQRFNTLFPAADLALRDAWSNRSVLVNSLHWGERIELVPDPEGFCLQRLNEWTTTRFLR